MGSIWILTYRGSIVVPQGRRISAYWTYSLADKARMFQAGKRAFDRWNEGRSTKSYEELYNEELENHDLVEFFPEGYDNG